jgi:hypothetical protein
MKAALNDFKKEPGEIQENITPQPKVRDKGRMTRIKPGHREGKN